MVVLVLLIECILLPTAGIAQDTTRVDPHSIQGLQKLRDQQQNPHARAYETAREIGDYQTAATALQYLLLESPQNSHLRDSLASMLYRAGNINACLRWCEKVLADNPGNAFLLELSGNLYAGQGRPAQALPKFEALSSMTGDAYFRYQQASMQFLLGRYGEATQNIESLLTDPAIEQEAIHIDWAGGGHDVPLRAALLNLRGNLQLALNRENDARKSFRAALKIDKNFSLARNNLNALREKDRERWEENDR